MTINNTTYRILVEKLGASDPSTFVGNEGETFYDPDANPPVLKLSDGSTPGGIAFAAGGSGGGGGESYWVSTNAGIHTLSNVGIGTTNPQTKLEIGGVLGFGDGNNVRIGDNTTGASLSSGLNNIFMGVGAGKSITTGSYNIFFGYYSGRLTTSGSNVFVGRASGYSNTSGEINTFLGAYAGNYNTTGNKNTFLGMQAGTYNSSGSDNVFLGSYTGISPSASRKVVLGSGFSISELFDAPDTTKDTQFAVGVRTDANPANYWLVGNENFNVGIGTTNPQTKLEIGGVLGFGANNNVKIGDNTTGASLTSGTNNIFMGVGAGNSVTSDTSNNFIGFYAGRFATGFSNNFFGYYAGYSLTGNNNTFLGDNAGGTLLTGSRNVIIGANAGAFSNNTSGSDLVLIGESVRPPIANEDNQLAIGNASGNWINGNNSFNVGIGTTNPTTKLTVGGDIRAGFTTSQGVILTSPNGTQYRLIVDNSGVLSTVAV